MAESYLLPSWPPLHHSKIKFPFNTEFHIYEPVSGNLNIRFCNSNFSRSIDGFVGVSEFSRTGSIVKDSTLLGMRMTAAGKLITFIRFHIRNDAVAFDLQPGAELLDLFFVRLEKSNLVDDIREFRQLTASVSERHLTSHQLATQRVLYVPCQVSFKLTRVIIDGVGVIGIEGIFRRCFKESLCYENK